MSTEAMEQLAKVLSEGIKYETMGHALLCQKAFPKPDDFDGSREAYANSDAQKAILAWRNNSLDAAKAIHESMLPEWGWVWSDAGKGHVTPNSQKYSRLAQTAEASEPARAWLLAILKALIAKNKRT